MPPVNLGNLLPQFFQQLARPVAPPARPAVDTASPGDSAADAATTRQGNRASATELQTMMRVQAGTASSSSPTRFQLAGRTLPPGFERYSTGGFTSAQITALSDLMDQPKDYPAMMATASNARAHTRELIAMLPAEEQKFLKHRASIAEWKEAISGQLDALRACVENGERLQYGDPTVLRNATLLDMLAVSANARAEYESTGRSDLLPEAGQGPVKPGAPALNLKRFGLPGQCASHIMKVQASLAGAAPGTEVRERAIFKLSEHVHLVGVDMVTRMHEGQPKTVLFCADGSSVAATVAQDLKVCLDAVGARNVTALVVHSHTQASLTDCPIFALFHAEKYRSAQDLPIMKNTIDKLFQDQGPAGSYQLPWGKSDGAKVLFVENDDRQGSRVLPPALLKEMQNGKRLRDTLSARGWSPQKANKKGENFLNRYQKHYVKGPDGLGWSSAMVEKAIKYYERSLTLLEHLETHYTPREGKALLKQLLDTTTSVGPGA